MSQTEPFTLQPTRLDYLADGTPFSPLYGDRYHNDQGALAQAWHVFLGGNDLPSRWRGRTQFVILETGFGLGHNFLATWQAWRDDPQACERLHFISVEKHPLAAEDLALAHQQSGAPADLSAQLLAAWPMRVSGFHRIELEQGRLVLSLLFGDANLLLPQCAARVDAIFLDGFAPARNPEMWSPTVFKALATMARPACTLATWSLAGAVRKGLTEAGFALARAPGFAGRHEMLLGCRVQDGARSDQLALTAHEDKRALIIGAGLAGTGMAERLAVRGWRVMLLDEAKAPAQGASGNAAGAFRPQPSRDDNLMARVTRAGFSYALRDLDRLAAQGHPVRWSQCGVLHVARDAVQERKQQEALAVLQAPPDFLQWVDVEAASRLAGHPTACGGWWFPKGGWINPPSLCEAHLAAAGTSLEARFGTHVARLDHLRGEWCAYGAKGQLLGSAPQLILANGHDAQRLLGLDWLPLFSARGQVSHIPAAQMSSTNTVVCGSGYLTPAIDGFHALGATFVVNDPGLDLRLSEHLENLDKLDKMLPGASQRIVAAALGGRSSLRPVTPDRLPMVGALPDRPGLWLLSGFGARGLVWGALCAELLASMFCDEPLPLERELVAALAPTRYQP